MAYCFCCTCRRTVEVSVNIWSKNEATRSSRNVFSIRRVSDKNKDGHFMFEVDFYMFSPDVKFIPECKIST